MPILLLISTNTGAKKKLPNLSVEHYQLVSFEFPMVSLPE